MNKHEIENYNRLCAEFLGYELITPRMRKRPEQWKDNSYWEHKDKANVHTSKKVLGRDGYLSFDSDWNWIMRMVEAIEKDKYLLNKERPYYLIIDNNYCGVFFNRWNDSGKDFGGTKQIVSIKANSKKEAVVQAINQFLIYYNNESSNKNNQGK